MGEVTEEVQKAAETLNLPKTSFQQLDNENAKAIFEDCFQHFVKSEGRRWWWEDFKNDSFSIENLEKPFEFIIEILPNTDEPVWLIVEDPQEEFYPVYECDPKVISDIIGECFGFEYYVVSKKKEWLICENHHSRLIGSGDFPEEMLKKIKARTYNNH